MFALVFGTSFETSTKQSGNKINNEIFPWSAVLSQKMIAARLVQKLPFFSARRKIIYRPVLRKKPSLDDVYSVLSTPHLPTLLH